MTIPCRHAISIRCINSKIAITKKAELEWLIGTIADDESEKERFTYNYTRRIRNEPHYNRDLIRCVTLKECNIFGRSQG